MTTKRQPKDENCLSGANHNDELKDALRKIDGIPDAVYLVCKGWVFVFDKLVALVKENPDMAGTPDSLDEEGVLGLMIDAWVSPYEAVQTWSVLPYPYSLATDPPGEGNPERLGWRIYHGPFNANLPGYYRDDAALNNALASLLLDEKLPGEGYFTHNGQSMILRNPLDPDLLPECPTLVVPADENDISPATCFRHLDGLTYEPGFAPIDNALFQDIKSREKQFAENSARATAHATNRLGELWQRTSVMEFTALNDPKDGVPDHMIARARELREIYPELSMVRVATLYEHFNAFQHECCYNDRWAPYRDDDFLLYLLGHVAGRVQDGPEAVTSGAIAAFLLLKGESLSTATEAARYWRGYMTAIRKLAFRVASATVFLEWAKQQDCHRGPEVSTMQDLLRPQRVSLPD